MVPENGTHSAVPFSCPLEKGETELCITLDPLQDLGAIVRVAGRQVLLSALRPLWRRGVHLTSVVVLQEVKSFF